MGNVSATVGSNFPMVMGNKYYTSGTAALSSSYATSGDSFTAATFGLGKVDHLSVTSAGGYTFEVDLTNSKILAYSKDSELYVTSDSTAVGTDGIAVLDGVAMLQHVAASQTVTDAVSIVEVASTTDLSGITFRFEAWGTG